MQNIMSSVYYLSMCTTLSDAAVFAISHELLITPPSSHVIPTNVPKVGVGRGGGRYRHIGAQCSSLVMYCVALGNDPMLPFPPPHGKAICRISLLHGIF